MTHDPIGVAGACVRPRSTSNSCVSTGRLPATRSSLYLERVNFMLAAKIDLQHLWIWARF
jgi:hypothetical protein